MTHKGLDLQDLAEALEERGFDVEYLGDDELHAVRYEGGREVMYLFAAPGAVRVERPGNGRYEGHTMEGPTIRQVLGWVGHMLDNDGLEV